MGKHEAFNGTDVLIYDLDDTQATMSGAASVVRRGAIPHNILSAMLSAVRLNGR